MKRILAALAAVALAWGCGACHPQLTTQDKTEEAQRVAQLAACHVAHKQDPAADAACKRAANKFWFDKWNQRFGAGSFPSL